MELEFLMKFTRKLPDWIPNIKAKTREKVKQSPLMKSCAEGTKTDIRALLIFFWPFVDVFPKIIQDIIQRLVQDELPKKYNVQNAQWIYETGQKFLKGIKGDEISHRTLWIRAAETMDISHEELAAHTPCNEVLRLNSHIGGEGTSLYHVFLRSDAVEIVAEGISHFLLASEKFRAIMGEEGIRWFRVHTEHSLIFPSHEELMYRLAFTLYDGDDFPPEREVETIVLDAVDHFDAVANRCMERIS